MESGSRYQVEIRGPELSRTRDALDGAGIATLASCDAAPLPGPGIARRLWRSTAFRIVLVLLLVFLAQRLVSPGERADRSYDAFLTQVEQAPGEIRRVTIDPDDSLVVVEQSNGEEYETGYPRFAEESLVDALRGKRITTIVEDSSGGTLLGLITYVLPFLLFGLFFLYVMRWMRREREAGGRLEKTSEVRCLTAFVEAESPEAAIGHLRHHLPAGVGYELGEAVPSRS